MTRHVAVLMGGMSAEREVSLVSGEACAVALEQRGYRVSRVDVDRRLPAVLHELSPDCCFNALHGRFGEDGRVQGVLDLMGIPYTHSGVLASAIAMDKPTAIRLFRGEGLRCPAGIVCRLGDLEDGFPLPAPLVVKPAAEGSSVGVTIFEDDDPSPLFRRNVIDREGRVLVEPFVAGLELTCAVLYGSALAVTLIEPSEGFYDYRAKYTDGVARHVVPAPLPEEVAAEVMRVAEVADRVLGCRGVSRSDFRYDPDAADESGLFLLEVNTQPGMTPLSLVPEQAAFRGIAFDELVVRLLEGARCDS